MRLDNIELQPVPVIFEDKKGVSKTTATASAPGEELVLAAAPGEELALDLGTSDQAEDTSGHVARQATKPDSKVG